MTSGQRWLDQSVRRPIGSAALFYETLHLYLPERPGRRKDGPKQIKAACKSTARFLKKTQIVDSSIRAGNESEDTR